MSQELLKQFLRNSIIFLMVILCCGCTKLEASSMMNLSPKGKQFLKNNEGFRDKAYKCTTQKTNPLYKDQWTIGYGTTIMVFNDGASMPVDGTTQITKQMADQFFSNDLKKFEKAVNSLVTVPLSQNQFDALVSFTYNVGVNGLKKSFLLRSLNKGDYAGAAKGFDGWHIPKDIISRRNREKGLFMKVGEFPDALEFKKYEKGEYPKP